MAVPELDPQQLKARLDAGQALRLLDVREPWEYAIAHLPGSTHMPLGQVSARWCELDREAPIVVVCKSGGRSRRAAEFLAAQGFGQVANLAGGIDAWMREIDPDLTAY